VKRQVREGFFLRSSGVTNDILIPRYYDPRVTESLESLCEEFDLVSLGELVKNGYVIHSHGDYVPKIFYGAGPYPYVRTSDLANWEIKASPKHGVPEFVYHQYATCQMVRPGDVWSSMRVHTLLAAWQW